ncbi:MAG: cyclic nucleotide-binding domain-containing protein [bacterium]|nr:cyclic nucleotide-binding domain-containing protein [bacterium]
MASVEQLKARFAEHLREKRLEGALDALVLLEREEPTKACWPQKRARLLRAKADPRGELEALRRALELQIDQGVILDAIASCQSILELAPEDSRTLETLDLLYLEGPPLESGPAGPALPRAEPVMAVPAARPALGPTSVPASWGEDADEPLDSLVLTDVVPGARSLPRDSGPGVNEIPIDLVDAVDESAPDLHLDRWSSSDDLRDVAAAQAICLPSNRDVVAAQAICLPNDDELAGTAETRGERGANLRNELANIPLFGDLDPASLHTLIRRVRAVSLEPGQILFRQGDPANSLYVIVEGAVVPIAEGDRRRKLAVLERGSFFGEIGLMTKQPRNATIEALVDTKLLAIDRRLVRQLIADAPGVAKSILRFLRARMIDRQIRTNLFFSAFAHAERAAVAKQFRFLEVADGAKVIERGRAPDGLYVVLSGELSVVGPASPGTGEPDKELATLGLSDVFGGLSLIEGRLPAGDVIARGKCWLVVLGEGRFRRILDANPRLSRVLRRIALAAAEESGTQYRDVPVL